MCGESSVKRVDGDSTWAIGRAETEDNVSPAFGAFSWRVREVCPPFRFCASRTTTSERDELMTARRSLRRRSGNEAGPRFRKLKAVSIVFLVIGSMAYLIQPASAVHDTGAFELDGNAVSASGAGGAAPDDWDRVCHEAAPAGTTCGTTNDTHGASAVAWTDDGGLSSSIFTGGGSKDPQNISSWAWKNGGGLPDKDNLLHSFAARYSLDPDPTTGDGNNTACPADLPTPPGGIASKCEVLFFGSDRYDNSGDAQQGFWFFQNKITLGTNAVGGGTGFSGVHKNGDLLVISDFSNGGTTSTIAVYQWDNTVSGNLRLLDNSSTAQCSTAG